MKRIIKVYMFKMFFIISAMFIFSTISYCSDTLVIAAEDFVPFVYKEKDAVVGIDVDVAREIFTKLGVKTEFKILPWARCWDSLKTGEVDVGPTVSKKAEREEFVYYPENFVWESKFVFFTNNETKAKYSIKSYDDVKKNNLKIGIINGNSYNDKFFQAFPFQDADKKVYNASLDPVANIDLNLKKLEINRINLYPADLIVGQATIKLMGLKGLTYYDDVLFSKPYPNVFSKASKFKNDKYSNITELLKAYDIALGEFKKTPRYKEIFDKYIK